MSKEISVLQWLEWYTLTGKAMSYQEFCEMMRSGNSDKRAEAWERCVQAGGYEALEGLPNA